MTFISLGCLASALRSRSCKIFNKTAGICCEISPASVPTRSLQGSRALKPQRTQKFVPFPAFGQMSHNRNHRSELPVFAGCRRDFVLSCTGYGALAAIRCPKTSPADITDFGNSHGKGEGSAAATQDLTSPSQMTFTSPDKSSFWL